MQLSSRSDQDLLGATDALSFEEFYLRHVNTVLGYFARRTGDAELAADLASETFAAALAGRRGYKPLGATGRPRKARNSSQARSPPLFA